MTDPYTPYETGLQAFLERLSRDHPRYPDALIYQQRLKENVTAARRYGDTETRRAERAEIVDRLNRLALETLEISYSALCRPDKGAPPDMPEAAPPLGHATHIDTGGGAYVAGNVTVHGGDFVGRDQTKTKTPPTSPETPHTTPAETTSLRRQLAEARDNLLLIEERISAYVMSTDVPLQLIKERRRLEARMAELVEKLEKEVTHER
ncbi:MAG TPA: hypothetical protein ENN19_12705 [Chloroflexi bacterium]|nr:hypothetical protein [Chloroflexota bacterium]